MGKTHLGQTAAALKRKGTAKDFALAHEWQAQTKRQAQQASGPLRQSPCTGGTTAQIRKIEEAAGFRQDSATPASNSGAGEEIRKLQDSIFKDRETLYGAIVPNSSEHHGAGVHIRQPIRSPRKPPGCPPAPAPALERPDQEGSQRPISQATHRPLSGHYQAIIRHGPEFSPKQEGKLGICRRALYGLPESAHAYSRFVSDVMTSMRWTRISMDQNI